MQTALREGGGLVAETWTMGRKGLWFVSGSTPRRNNKRRTWIDLSKNPRGFSLPCLVPLSKAPYSPNICSPGAILQPYRFEPESGGSKPGCVSPSALAPQRSPAVGAGAGAAAASFHTFESTFRGVPGVSASTIGLFIRPLRCLTGSSSELTLAGGDG
ncbi:unnamed protein product [Pleuronectes platessa]|uniref:Uncharacterized protein n=1 Tax=Pleuronectes platessa TaxID=8262 RepID=A0A9N7YUJ5_PLEPL|nr:unnamed protein product [Pleuronectes platessa]